MSKWFLMSELDGLGKKQFYHNLFVVFCFCTVSDYIIKMYILNCSLYNFKSQDILRFGHENISMVILLLLLIQEEHF